MFEREPDRELLVKLLAFLEKEMKLMATLADSILAIQAQVTALQTAVAALPTTAGSDAAVLAALAGVQTTANSILADLTPTPAPAPAA